MQVPETPITVEQLDLMKQLKAYADGNATWKADGGPVVPKEKKACDPCFIPI